MSAFVQSKSFVSIIRGPLGSGKTTAAAFKVFKNICTQKPDSMGVRKSTWAAIRNTYPDLAATTIRDWKRIVPESAGPLVMGHPPEHKLNFNLPDGTTVDASMLFLALDRPDHERKLRGFNGTGLWLNELKELPKQIFDQAMGRADRFPIPGWSDKVGLIGDTNAWDKDHWLETLSDLYRLGELPNYEFFTQPGAVKKKNGKWVVNVEAENLVVLRSDYYERQIAGKKEDWIKVNLANEIGLSYDGKAVHGDYSDSTHTAQELLYATPGIDVHVGCDFGLTPATVFQQRQPNGRWHVLEEIVTEADSKMGAEKMSLAIKAKCAEMKAQTPGLHFIFRGDPAGDQGAQTDEQTVFQIMRRNGIPIMPASTQDPAIRRDAVDRPLTRMIDGGPGILYSPKVKNLRKALAGAYHYKRVRMAGETERFQDKPDKSHPWSDVVEAHEYGLMDAGEHAIVNPTQNHVMFNQPVRPTATWNPFTV